jgi:cobyrinic acid a,c-diamide synthase
MEHRFLVAATSSGCGKTTFTMGLLRALADEGLRVQPFKCGPDYIDTAFHRQAAGRPSINLDSFMMSRTHIQTIYNRFAREAEVSVTEGVMGLYDGYDRWHGSSYELSVWTRQPVVLIVNAASTAYSVAATIHGFRTLRTDLSLAGVVFNRVASPSHYAYLEAACRDIQVPTFGYLTRQEGLEVPSRHLGLTIDNRPQMEDFIRRAAQAVREGVDIPRLLQATACPLPQTETQPAENHPESPAKEVQPENWHIAVAHDEAFNFLYPQNLEALRRLGTVEEFSPLHDALLPPDIEPRHGILYLPGGYPELYAEALAANTPMRAAIRQFAARGGRIYAECGGMIYLTQDLDGQPMCGVLPLHTTLQGARLHLGYRSVRYAGTEWRGHEFHYSQLREPGALPSVAPQFRADGKPVDTALYRQGNVVAGYTHLYWAEQNFIHIFEQNKS